MIHIYRYTFKELINTSTFKFDVRILILPIDLGCLINLGN